MSIVNLIMPAYRQIHSKKQAVGDHLFIIFSYITSFVISMQNTSYTMIMFVSVEIFVSYGVLRFDSRWGLGMFLFTIVSRTALRLTQPPI